MVAADSYVDKIFADGCWSTGRTAKFCMSDEHYIPTLLAWHGERRPGLETLHPRSIAPNIANFDLHCLSHQIARTG